MSSVPAPDLITVMIGIAALIMTVPVPVPVSMVLVIVIIATMLVVAMPAVLGHGDCG